MILSDADKIQKLKKLCDNYNKHLDKETNFSRNFVQKNNLDIIELKNKLQEGENLTSFSNKEIARLKQDIILRIIRSLDLSEPNKINYIKAFLESKNSGYSNLRPAAILSTQRSSGGVKFFENILHLLTFGIYSKATKGTASFWKSHGEAMVDAMREITDSNQSPPSI